jgi:hypothetical protein
MLIVAEDLIGAAMVQDRIPGAPFADGTEFFPHAWTSGLSTLPHQALAQGVDHGLSQGFAGLCGQLTRQAVGFRVFDA